MKGIYVLIVSVGKEIRVDVGALGSLRFKKGIYAYVGSAQMNLEARVKRHLGERKKLFWHIDYLLDSPYTKILKVFHKDAQRPEECETARFLETKGFPIDGFGSSDCECESHLFKIRSYEFLTERMNRAEVRWQ